MNGNIQYTCIRIKDEFVVEKIVSHRGKTKNTIRFLVHWLGYPDSEDSEIGFDQAKDLAALDAYLVEHPELNKLFSKKI